MNRRQSPTIFFCLAVSVVLGTMHRAQAQTPYGSVVGNVKDASEVVVAGVSITLTNLGTALSREATTAETGAYSFATVPPGTYEIKASKAGFASYTRSGVIVAANDTERVDITLSVGAVSDSVTVTGGAALLQTDRAEVRTDLGSNQLSNLPMSIGRNYQTLFITLPGFGGVQSSYNSTPSNPSKALVFNVNGASFNINNTKIDGAQSINVWLPHESAYVPTLEAIDSVNVVSGSFDAETGLAGRAAIFVSTKSGTNDLHGVAFESHNNQHLNARPFFRLGVSRSQSSSTTISAVPSVDGLSKISSSSSRAMKAPTIGRAPSFWPPFPPLPSRAETCRAKTIPSTIRSPAIRAAPTGFRSPTRSFRPHAWIRSRSNWQT